MLSWEDAEDAEGCVSIQVSWHPARPGVTPDAGLLMVAIGLLITRHLCADVATAIAAAFVAPGTLLIEAAQLQAGPTAPRHGALSTSCRAQHPAMDHLAETPHISGGNTGSPVPHLQECPHRHGRRRCECTSDPRDTVNRPHIPLSTAQHWAGAQAQCHALWAGKGGHLVTELRLCVLITYTERGEAWKEEWGQAISVEGVRPSGYSCLGRASSGFQCGHGEGSSLGMKGQDALGWVPRGPGLCLCWAGWV